MAKGSPTANPGKTGQEAVDKALAQMADTINAIGLAALQGVDVHNLRASSSPGTIKVAHGLGYPPKGWLVTRTTNANPTELYEIHSPNPAKELWLNFVGDTTCTLTVRVY